MHTCVHATQDADIEALEAEVEALNAQVKNPWLVRSLQRILSDRQSPQRATGKSSSQEFFVASASKEYFSTTRSTAAGDPKPLNPEP